MGAGLNELNVKVFRDFSRGRSRNLHLLLDYLLFLFLKFINEIMSQFKNNCDKGFSDWLIHLVFEFDFLAYQIHSCTSFLQQPRIEFQRSDALAIVAIIVYVMSTA